MNHWIRWVAKRYLRAKKNTRFLSVSTLLSIVGIGLGVAAIIVVLCVMSGFERELRTKLSGNDLHVLITPKQSIPGFNMGGAPESELRKLPALSELQSHPDVALFSMVISAELILRHGNKVSGVLVKGVDANRMKRLDEKVIERALPQMLQDRESSDKSRYPGVIVGRELAYELGLIPGDFITLISPVIVDGPFSNIPRVKRFVVEAIYKMGVPDVESQEVFMTRQNMESFLRERGQVTRIEVTLKDPSQSSDWITPFAASLPDLSVRDWNQLNGHLFASMKLERIAMFLILLFTVAIASLNIVSTLTLMVQEKIKEIAILRTLGAKRADIRGIFLLNGIWVGGTGVVWGTVIALLVTYTLGHADFISLPDVYYDRKLPVNMDPIYFLGVPFASFAIVLFAAYFPAKRASQLTPLDGIRNY